MKRQMGYCLVAKNPRLKQVPKRGIGRGGGAVKTWVGAAEIGGEKLNLRCDPAQAAPFHVSERGKTRGGRDRQQKASH